MPTSLLLKHTSKHARKPFKGAVNISTHSGLRKCVRLRAVHAADDNEQSTLPAPVVFINLIIAAELAND